MKSRAQRRHNNDKIIKKRLRILEECWGYNKKNRTGPLREQRKPGMLRKWNFTCDCAHREWDRHYHRRTQKIREESKFPKDWKSEYYY